MLPVTKTMCDVKIVSIDSQGRATSDAECYKEHTCSLEYFYKKIVKHPKAGRVKSEVAALCGLDLKIYFHRSDEMITHVENKAEINHAATLLTMDPSTGLAKNYIQGVAYVVMNDGLAPLSRNQVYGIVELVSDVSSYFECDPDHEERGKEELAKLTRLYRKQCYGPLSIYKSREDGTINSAAERLHMGTGKPTPKKSARKPFSSLQV